MKKYKAIMLMLILGLTQFAFGQTIIPEFYPWGFSVRTNSGASIALMRIDLYPLTEKELFAWKELAMSRGDLISNYKASESNSRSEAATLRLQADVERKACAARIVKERIKGGIVGLAAGILMTGIFAVLIK